MNDEYTLVATAAGRMEAEILRGLLEAHGVPVWLLGESAGSAIGLGVGPLGEIDVRVPAEYEEQAREILAQYYSDLLVDDEESDS